MTRHVGSDVKSKLVKEVGLFQGKGLMSIRDKNRDEGLLMIR